MILNDVTINGDEKGIELNFNDLKEYNSMQSSVRRAIIEKSKMPVVTDSLNDLSKYLSENVVMQGEEPHVKPSVIIPCDPESEELLIRSIFELLFVYTYTRKTEA